MGESTYKLTRIHLTSLLNNPNVTRSRRLSIEIHFIEQSLNC